MTDEQKQDDYLVNENAAARFSMDDILREEPKLDAREEASDEKMKVAASQPTAANFQNADGSTEPRSDADRVSPATKSFKHGLLGKFALIEGEDPQQFSEFVDGALADLRPEGTVQEYFAERWIKDAWLLDRIDKVISALLVTPESLGNLSLSELFNHLKFISGETGQRFDKLPEIMEFLKEKEKARTNSNMRATTESKLDDGTVEESRLALTRENSYGCLED